MAHEINLNNVKSITRTTWQKPERGLYWIGLVITDTAGNTTEVQIFAPMGDKATFDRLNTALSLREISNAKFNKAQTAE